MAFAGYGETQRRRARFRGAHRRGGAHGGVVYVLGCIPATLPTLAALALCSLVTVFLLASRINDRDQSVEPGSAQMSSFAAAVGAGAMRRGERDPTLDGDVGMQMLAGARTSASARGDGDGGLSPALGPSAAFCALPFDPLVCAHGTVGASHWPEASGVRRPLPNTVPALAAAVAAGHECVEVDVSRSKDGHLVALHARELRRLTDNRHANVGELTLEEILNLPVPGGGYSVATFAEAMATVMRRGLKQITVDFKEDDAGQGDSFRRDVAAEAFGVAPRSSVAGTRGFGQAVLSAIAAVDETGMGCLECVFWGKSDDVMLEILRENPEARVGFTVANFSRAIRDAGLDSVDPLERELIRRASAGARVVAAVQSEMIEPALTKRLRAENVRDVYAWTVNDEARIRRVANHGVHGIVTDEPEEATRVVRAMRAMCDSPVFGGALRDQPSRRAEATSDDGEKKQRGRTESDANPARPRAFARGRRASPGTRGRDEG